MKLIAKQIADIVELIEYSNSKISTLKERKETLLKISTQSLEIDKCIKKINSTKQVQKYLRLKLNKQLHKLYELNNK